MHFIHPVSKMAIQIFVNSIFGLSFLPGIILLNYWIINNIYFIN